MQAIIFLCRDVQILTINLLIIFMVNIIDPRVAMKFAVNRKLKRPIDREIIISLLFILNQ